MRIVILTSMYYRTNNISRFRLGEQPVELSPSKNASYLKNFLRTLVKMHYLNC